MTLHSLFPSYVEINYECQGFGPHTMIRPTRAWVGVPWTGPGQYEAWDESTISASVMVNNFIDLLIPIFTPETSFTGFTIYNLSAPGADPIPVYAELLTGQIGTVVTAIQFATYQKTLSFITAANEAAKIVLLDVPTGGVISKSRTVSGAEAALVAEFMSETNAWSARDDNRVVAFRTISNGVNDALKKAYRR